MTTSISTREEYSVLKDNQVYDFAHMFSLSTAG